jgi:hypothetical protein
LEVDSFGGGRGPAADVTTGEGPTFQAGTREMRVKRVSRHIIDVEDQAIRYERHETVEQEFGVAWGAPVGSGSGSGSGSASATYDVSRHVSLGGSEDLVMEIDLGAAHPSGSGPAYTVSEYAKTSTGSTSWSRVVNDSASSGAAEHDLTYTLGSGGTITRGGSEGGMTPPAPGSEQLAWLRSGRPQWTQGSHIATVTSDSGWYGTGWAYGGLGESGTSRTDSIPVYQTQGAVRVFVGRDEQRMRTEHFSTAAVSLNSDPKHIDHLQIRFICAHQ